MITDEEILERYKKIDLQLKMVKKIRKKIAEMEKVLQEATKYGMSGKISITTDKTLVKTEEKFSY